MFDSWEIYAIAALGAICIVLLCLIVYLNKKIKDLYLRYNYFMGAEENSTSLEEKISEYIRFVKDIDNKYKKVIKKVDDLEDNIAFCSQKIGVVRYNPFDNVGGNLCFCIAILNGNDTGVVINGIYSKTGTFTYAKNIENGKSSSKLSKEEIEAIKEAQKNAYNPVSGKEINELLKEYEGE